MAGEPKVSVNFALSSELPVPPGASEEIGKIILAHLEAQALAGRDASGRNFPAAKGRNEINLHDTGELWGTAEVQPALGPAGQIHFPAAHAFVLEKYKADGLNPQSQADAEREIELLLTRENIVL